MNESGAGRKPLRGGKRVQSYTVGLDEDDVAYLAALSANRTAAVRACIAWHRATHSAAFAARCAQDGRDPREVLAEMMWGYITMPTAAEVREALERGPQDE
jgi:hypothetical protein